MSKWKEYTGSDEQIADMENAEHGFLLMIAGKYKGIYKKCDLCRFNGKLQLPGLFGDVTHYWIIPADPLREMKIRQARTGQPVWINKPHSFSDRERVIYETTTPDWNIPNAEYSFTPFEELNK